MVTKKLFTAVQWKKKQTKEKVASLMILANEFCYKNKTHMNACKFNIVRKIIMILKLLLNFTKSEFID